MSNAKRVVTTRPDEPKKVSRRSISIAPMIAPTQPVRLSPASGVGRPIAAPGGLRERRSSRVAPEEMLLLLLAEASGGEEALTQRQLAREMGASQPSISRSLARLEARREVRIHLISLLGQGRAERGYTLSPDGAARVERFRAELRQTFWPGHDLTLGDLEASLSGTRLSTLLIALRQGTSPAALMASHRPEDDLRVPSTFFAGSEAAPAGGRGVGRPGAGVPLVGRVAERLRLVRALRSLGAPGAQGEVLLLLGPAGVGKSRLLEFAVEHARSLRYPVISGRVLSGPRLPFSPFEEMFAAGGRAWGSPALADPGAGVPARSPPRASRRTDATAFWTESKTQRGLRIPRVRRMLGYLERIEGLSRHGPLLIVLDDLERASPASLQVYHFLATNIPRLERPVLFLGASRDEEEMDRPGPLRGRNDLLDLQDRLRRSNSPHLEVLRLGPLSSRESRVLLRAPLDGGSAPDLPPSVARHILERSRGNPLFLLEGAREGRTRLGSAPLAPQGAGRGTARVSSRPLPVPASVRRMLRSRLAALPPARRRLLEMAACIGEEFEVAPLRALVVATGAGRPSEVIRGLWELSERWHLLRPTGPLRYAFTHLLFQETLLETASERERWSGLLASWWEQSRPEEVGVIALLYHAARDQERGLPWIESAIERAMQGQAYENVGVYVRAAHDLLAQRPGALRERAAKDIALANRLWALGSIRATRSVLESVLSHPLPSVLRWEAEATLLNALAATAPGEARAGFEELQLEVVRSHGGRVPELLLGEIASISAFLLGQAGDWEGCLRSAEAASAHLSGTNDWIWTTWALFTRGVALLSLGRGEEALALCRESRRRYTDELYLPFRALLDNLEGRIQLVAHDSERARQCFDEGFRLSRRIGNVSVMASLLANRAAAELMAGDAEGSGATIDELSDLAEKFDLSVHSAWAQYRRAQWLWMVRRQRESVEAFREAREAFLRIGLFAPALLPQVYEACLDVQHGVRKGAEATLTSLLGALGTVDPDERVLLPAAVGGSGLPVLRHARRVPATSAAPPGGRRPAKQAQNVNRFIRP